MIKETVDAVRIAELEAEKIVYSAKEEAASLKEQVKVKAGDYRTEELNKARIQAESLMNQVKAECESYNRDRDEAIEKEAEDLQTDALKKQEQAVNAVINALF